MAAPPDFTLRSPRTLGDVFNDTFRFIKLALPTWWPTILKVVLPLALVCSALVGGGYGVMMGAMIEGAGQVGQTGGDDLAAVGLLGLVAMLGLIGFGAVSTWFSAFVFASMAAYDRFGTFDGVTQAQLRAGATARFWPLVGLGLLGAAAFVPAALLVLIPCLGMLLLLGLMFAALGRLGLSAAAIGIDRQGIFESVETSQRVTKGAFWQTLGIFLVASIVANLLVSGFTFAPTMLGLLFVGLTAQEAATAGAAPSLEWIGVGIGIFYGITICLSLLVSVVGVVASGIQYAQLSEGKDLTLLRRRIAARQADLGLEGVA